MQTREIHFFAETCNIYIPGKMNRISDGINVVTCLMCFVQIRG